MKPIFILLIIMSSFISTTALSQNVICDDNNPNTIGYYSSSLQGCVFEIINNTSQTNTSQTVSVPEPSTILLLIFGVFGIALRKFKVSSGQNYNS